MKVTAPFILILFALLTALFSLIGDDSYGRLIGLRHSVEQQNHANKRLANQVDTLKREVAGLQNNPRALEKAARNELGMARDGEIVVLFDGRNAVQGPNGKGR